MSRGKTLSIHDMFNNFMSECMNEVLQTSKEVQEQNIEKRQWFIDLSAFIKRILRAISSNQSWHNLFCCMQMMVTVFASLSITWSALANLAYFGLSTFWYTVCVAAIMTMSCYTCILAAVHYVQFGLEGNKLLRYQKLRSVEIKLFRSPDMPNPENSKTEALIEYINYYAIEKSALKLINEVWANNTRVKVSLLNADWIPIELKTRIALVMSARKSSDPAVNQRRICRLIRDEYSRVYNKIDKENLKLMSENRYITCLYETAESDSLTEEGFRMLCPEEDCNPEQWVARVIVAHTLHRFAYFARKHGQELAIMLNKEKNGHWSKLSAHEKNLQMVKAFKWSMKQHLKRQNKKVSNANVGHFFMTILKTCFIMGAASMPAGFGLLASSPVAAIITYFGSDWSCRFCAWFWFSGVVDYLNTSRKDAEKTWHKICEYINKNWIQKESRNPKIEQHTWSLSWDVLFRAVVTFSMTCARSIFTYNSIRKLISNPSVVGGELLFHRIFHLFMPWLRPVFLPWCACLSFIDGLLHFAQITKYYSTCHLPRPKRGKVNGLGGGVWGVIRQQLNYLWQHNFNFSKHGVSKSFKLLGSIVALLQTAVLFVSAQQVLGTALALSLMPSVALAISASNRRNIEAGTDLWHQFIDRDFFDINLKNKYPNWFQVKRSQRSPSIFEDPRKRQVYNQRSTGETNPSGKSGLGKVIIDAAQIERTTGPRMERGEGDDERRKVTAEVEEKCMDGRLGMFQSTELQAEAEEENPQSSASSVETSVDSLDVSPGLLELSTEEYTPPRSKSSHSAAASTPVTDAESVSPNSVRGSPHWKKYSELLKRVRSQIGCEDYGMLAELMSDEISENPGFLKVNELESPRANRKKQRCNSNNNQMSTSTDQHTKPRPTPLSNLLPNPLYGQTKEGEDCSEISNFTGLPLENGEGKVAKEILAVQQIGQSSSLTLLERRKGDPCERRADSDQQGKTGKLLHIDVEIIKRECRERGASSPRTRSPTPNSFLSMKN